MKDETTISGLLKKREELQRENAELRERMAILSNDIEAIDRVLDAFGFRTSVDVTGGSISTLPEQTAYRLACMLYVWMIPQTGLKEACDSLADIFNWHTRPISPQILPDRRHLFTVATMTDVKAPPMVFDEE